MIEKANIKKALRLIFVDFFGLVIGILNGFFLPMVFSIEGYALFKTFSLYATYAIVFSFGLSDGLYLLYGGKNESNLDTSKTKAYYLFLVKIQAAVCIVMFTLSYFILKDTALIFFSIFIIPLQLIHFFRLYYRALGEFDKYSFLQAILVIFELLNTLFIVIYVRSQDPNLFIYIKIINHMLVAALLSMLFWGKHKAIKAAKLKWLDYSTIMKPGFVVLIADLLAALIFSLDRWFVKVLFSNEDFAYYSFAVSILNLFLVFIASITNIFYSYISQKLEDARYIKHLKNIVIIVSSFFPIGYFILQYIVKTYLAIYTPALEVLWILILTLPFITVINVLYINLYKASKSIKVYLKKMMITLAISFILNIVAFIIFGTTVALAWATFAAFIIWYFYSSKDFQGTKINMREVLYLSVLIVSFIGVKVAELSLILSLIILILALLINIYTFYIKDVLHMLNVTRNK